MVRCATQVLRHVCIRHVPFRRHRQLDKPGLPGLTWRPALPLWPLHCFLGMCLCSPCALLICSAQFARDVTRCHVRKGPSIGAAKVRALQEYLSNNTRLGIPASIYGETTHSGGVGGAPDAVLTASHREPRGTRR